MNKSDLRNAADAPHLGQTRSSPLHRQLADGLRGQIDSGKLKPGDSVPSENTLVQQFGVSRGTVRQALATLRAEGKVAGTQGRPLVVLAPHLTQPLSHLISFSTWALSLGKRPSGKVIESGEEPANAAVAEALGLQLGDSVYHLVRVRFADDEPLMIERTSFLPSLGARVAEMELGRQSIYAELAREGIVFGSARHLISVIAASQLDAELLQVCRRTPLVRVHRQAFSLAGEPLEWSDDRYLGRVNFRVENTATAGYPRTGVIRQLA